MTALNDNERREYVIISLKDIELSSNQRFAVRRLKMLIHQNPSGMPILGGLKFKQISDVNKKKQAVQQQQLSQQQAHLQQYPSQLSHVPSSSSSFSTPSSSYSPLITSHSSLPSMPTMHTFTAKAILTPISISAIKSYTATNQNLNQDTFFPTDENKNGAVSSSIVRTLKTLKIWNSNNKNIDDNDYNNDKNSRNSNHSVVLSDLQSTSPIHSAMKSREKGRDKEREIDRRNDREFRDHKEYSPVHTPIPQLKTQMSKMNLMSASPTGCRN